MNIDQKISEMLINVSGELLKHVKSKQEMQAHLDLVFTAWNMAINSELKRKRELKSFLKKQKKYAPNIEALRGLEWEIRRIMKAKDRDYPKVNKRIVSAEAVETSKDEYIIRAFFETDTN